MIGFLAAVIVIYIYVTTPAETPPPLPTSDLYTHLSVARHLVRGEGFVTDITYPLSFAHDFARKRPQPLIHRSPGYTMLLVGPVLAAHGDPELAVRYTRWLQLVFLFLLIWLGMRAYLQRFHILSLLLWYYLLRTNPLFQLALDWSMVEVACALILMFLWLRMRDRTADPTPLDGLLTGVLALLRPDLIWVPILWWLWVRRTTLTDDPTAVKSGHRFFSPRLRLALLITLLTVTPWLVRNSVVTGNPLFSLQGEAELVKDTSAWPQYTVYKQLAPQPLDKVLTGDLVPVARKCARGLKFYGREIGSFMPLPQLAVGILVLLWVLLGFFSRKWSPPAPESSLGPIALAVGTLGLLCCQYAPFDHSLRHLLVLLPILTWELAPVFSDNLVNNLQKIVRQTNPVLRGCLGIIPPPYAIMAAVAFLLLFSAFPILPLTGWDQAVDQAEQLAPQVLERAAQIADSEEQVLFVAWPAVTWYADRPAVWDPDDDTVRQKIRAWLTHDH